MSRTFLLALFLAPGAALAAAFAGIEVPPPPAPRPVVDTHWDTKVEDPYRFLEDTAAPEVQALMRAQAEAAAAILAKLPGREKLLARIREIDAEVPAVVTAVRRDERGGLFYLKREAKDNQAKLYRRAGPGGAEKLIADPEVDARATGKPHAIGGYAHSHDGRLVAYQISSGGTEIGVLRVIDVASGKEVTPPIDRVRGAGVSWVADGSGSFYMRLPEGWEQRPRAERYMDVRTWFRRLADPGADRAVFGPGMFPEVPIERSASGYVSHVHGYPIASAFVSHGVDRNGSLYFAELEDVLAGKPRWRRIYDQSAQVQDVAAGGGYLYVKSSMGAPRFKVMRAKLPEADLAKAELVVAPGEDVITDIASTREALYIARRVGAAERLSRLDYAAGAKPRDLELPVEGSVAITSANPRMDGVILSLGGWTRAASHYAIGPGDERPVPLGLAPPGRFDAPANMIAREVKVKSHDGVEVPVSIVSRRDLKLDGGNPTMLYGYGAYGIVEKPSLNPRILAWLEQGGVLAVAHVRGGGIYGDGWRRAAWKTTKPNTWKDGIAIAEWLIANGYTSRGKLSIYGGSAGAIFVGRAVTERPDLFGAAVIAVGNTDSVRSEFRANGAGNIPEYGTVGKEDEFRGLLAMSTYNNVKPDTPYPAILFEHGVNDTRVDVWMTLKTGSRMAAATTSGKPVLMRLEYDAGHGVGATRDQAQRRTADRWAFLLWQAGAPDFQPK
jgi:prolyl oligopeptidase